MPELLDTDSEEIEDQFELKTDLNFTDWPDFKMWLDNFAKKKGFNYKIRNSRTDGTVIRNIVYECSRSGIHNPQYLLIQQNGEMQLHSVHNALGNLMFLVPNQVTL